MFLVTRRFLVLFLAALPISLSFAANAACSTSLTVNLTVELSPALAKAGEDILIELRQGVVGHSKVMNSQKFHGKTGTVFFGNLCAGSYFMDIGNGQLVAVTPVHEFGDNGRYVSTIRVTFSNGNVATKNRNEL
jgi:uncharacterized protein (DUF2141 family)